MNPVSAERKEIVGLHRITKKVLRNLCKKHQLYQTPELNDVLYLHYQGFQFIECLEEYTELKCLWLECNAISEIQGLESQSKLKCLFLQNNLIKNIENLEYCKELDTLNLASNHIRKIANCGIEVLPVLNTLNLSSNCLRDCESLRGLEECKSLSVLDLANNRIDDILVVKVFAKMPQLRVLVLQGNPVVSKIPQYRKTLILECKELTYLDSRPVFPKDRACAEAWKRGGYNEERKEQARWNRRDRKKIRDSVNATIRMRNKHKSVDEQMDLITSSDSETDEGKRKEARERRQAASNDPRLILETGEDLNEEETLKEIWDEVSGPDCAVKKVENENQEEFAVEESLLEQGWQSANNNNDEKTKVEQTQKLEISEQVNVADILKMVDQPLMQNNDADELPELVGDDVAIENHAQQQHALIEEINNEQIMFEAVQKETQQVDKKRLFIEEVFNETVDVDENGKDNAADAFATKLTTKEDKTELLQFESEEKKPLWIDEIFSQPLVASSNENIQADNVDETLLMNEIEKEIKQGAIKKRRPINRVSTTTTTPTANTDFYKYVENMKLVGEFDLNFDGIDAAESEFGEISDFEEIHTNDPSIEQLSTSLLQKCVIDNEPHNETHNFLELRESPQSFFKLSPRRLGVCTTDGNVDEALLVEDIENEEPIESGFKIVAIDTTASELERNESCILDSADETSSYKSYDASLGEPDGEKLGLISNSLENAVNDSKSTANQNVELFDNSALFEQSLNVSNTQDTTLTDPISNINAMADCEGQQSLQTTVSDTESELSNASDDLTSDNDTTDENEKLTLDDNIATKSQPYLTKAGLEALKRRSTNFDDEMSSSSTESEVDDATKLEFTDTANAICDVVMSHVGPHEQPVPEKTSTVAKFCANDNATENYEPEMEMEKMLQLLPYDESEEIAKRLISCDDGQPTEEVVVNKTPEQMKYDAECEEINRQVEVDFEALNANMEYFIETFQEERQQIKGEINLEEQEETKINDVEVVDKSQSESEPTAFEKNVQTDFILFHQRKAADDVQYEFVYEEEQQTSKLINDVECEDIKKESELDMKSESKADDDDDDDDELAPFKVERKKVAENTTELLMHNDDLVKGCGDHAGIGQMKQNLPFLELEEVLNRPSIKAFEQEAIELKALLHKLELQNEKLTCVKNSCDAFLARETISMHENTDDEEDAEEISQLIPDMTNSLVDEIISNIKEKPKNYIITDLESDEEFSYTGPPKPAEPPVKSIQDVLGDFNKLIKDIARKNREESQRERMKFMGKRMPTTEKAKRKSLQTLLETPTLLEHHKSTAAELEPQVEAVKECSTMELKQMVERVYAQKDKYDDSLDVIDGRLVVVKKHTGEVEELSDTKNSTQYRSDEEKEEEYDTANSCGEADEDENDKKPLIWDFSMGAGKPHTYVPKYRPTMRKSATELILNALERNEMLADSDNQDEETEQEKADDGNSLEASGSKSSVFSNIDEDFFKNLDFKQIAEESAQDENFVEVARSYEELKEIIKQSGVETARSVLTNEEQNIANIIESKQEQLLAIDVAENTEILENENMLMHKLVQRTREDKECGEEFLNTKIEPEDKAYVIDLADSLEDIKCEFDSDQETVVDELASNRTLIFDAAMDELEPQQAVKNVQVVKMLKKLQLDDPIAKDLLAETIAKKPQDFGEFTPPLELIAESECSGDNDIENSMERLQAKYAEKLAAYKQLKMEKQASIQSTEVAIQCQPDSFDNALMCIENSAIKVDLNDEQVDMVLTSSSSNSSNQS